MKKKENKQRNFFKERKELIIIISALFVVLGLLLVFLPNGDKQNNTAQNNAIASDGIDKNVVVCDPLTGEVLNDAEKDDFALPHVFAVMVENSANAWPLSGLDKAFLVIEAPVEGGIPRFLAFYSEKSEAKKIGPVRSARPYYLDWAAPWRAVYAHVGGSPQALQIIAENYKAFDLNQFWQGEYFWRQNDNRQAPHNVYTSTELLNKSLTELNLPAAEYESWKYTADKPVDHPVSIKVNFAASDYYNVEWLYQNEDNSYTRYQNGSQMLMSDGAKITAKNIIIIETDTEVIDDQGRLRLRTLGSGRAVIVQNGEVFSGNWRKDFTEDRIRFYTDDGYEISMVPGVSWIEVVDDLNKVSKE